MTDTADVTRIDVPGTHNFREVAPEGVRPGRLFRSDAIGQLGEAGRAAVADLGIRRVIDLRTPEESALTPDDLEGTGIEVVANPLFSGSIGSMLGGPISLGDLYLMMVGQSGAAIAAALGEIADADGGVLVHCTAGKDRTGVVVALALAVAGVDRETILTDYEATAGFLAGEWAERMLAGVRAHGVEPTPDLVELITGSPRAALESVFASIDEHGGLGAYLDQSGFDADARARLRAALQDGAGTAA
ncbi:tyrosine-protein phosphatase [Agromyces seonyuensis]|uniref:Protein-tyrosine-phosphatase n=1 Tax=Agromyces seonyuensis TaxID=2662446 RepID=A0A6I4NXB5_9MICO|nr:tyrosine-protein phosphatase [Agromyces seonyuensis]MWB97155.1 protein-tyrosine-phosphatase [Agromyces seonyuensis]